MSIYNSSHTFKELNSIFGRKGARLHLSGILGAGMSSLAHVLTARGYLISGSDERAREREEYLGALRVMAPDRANIIGIDALIYTTALSDDDAELCEAVRLGIPTVSRAEALGFIMHGYTTRIGVSGSHGKSTVTAVIDSILCEAGLSPTTVSGATLWDGSSYRLGSDDYFIYESCEYKDAFLHFYPSVQLITGVELDHTDYFPDTDAIRQSFRKCVKRADRLVVINGDDEGARSIIPHIDVPVVTYGSRGSNDYYYNIISRSAEMTEFSVYRQGRAAFNVRTRLLGEYNIQNLVGAMALSDSLGIDRGSVLRAAENFQGIDRRMALLGQLGGRSVYYDYAHHPKEIAAAIDAVRERHGECTVVFCPHTFSRTKSLWNDFIHTLCKAEFTILMDIYPAREKPIDGITSEKLAEAIGNSAVRLDECDVLSYTLEATRGAVILMGAGDLESVKSDFLRKIQENKNKRG